MRTWSCLRRPGWFLLVGYILVVLASNPVKATEGVEQCEGGDTLGQRQAYIPPVLADFDCPGEGHFPHPTNCSKFYQCVFFFFKGFAYEKDCPNGTVFDSTIQVCNHPSSVLGPCGSFHENLFNSCQEEGYFINPYNSSLFYRCANNTWGGYDRTDYECPNGTVFDTKESVCNTLFNMNQATTCLP